MKKKSGGNVISNSFNSAVEAVSDKANEVVAAVKKKTAPARKKAEAAVKDFQPWNDVIAVRYPGALNRSRSVWSSLSSLIAGNDLSAAWIFLSGHGPLMHSTVVPDGAPWKSNDAVSGGATVAFSSVNGTWLVPGYSVYVLTTGL